jgi:sugar phosphate isomerase/epimerase
MHADTTRRNFLHVGAATILGTPLVRALAAQNPEGSPGRELFARRTGSRLKVSCCAYSFNGLLKSGKMKLEEFIDLCADMNLDGTELTSYYFPPNAGREYFRQIRRQAYLNGLDVSGTSVGNRFTLPAGADRDKQIALVRTWIDHAVEIGAPCIRVFAGEAPKGKTVEQARAWCIECLAECLKHATERGVFLALENHGGIVTTSDQTLACLTAIQSPWYGLNLDTGNFREADPYAAIAKTAPYAVNVHLKTEVQSTTHGSSPTDYDRVAQILKASGYRGYLSLEYEAREDPRTGVPRHIKAIQAAVAKANG